MPWVVAFLLERAFPAGVRGPVDRAAFRRFASAFAGETMGSSFCVNHESALRKTSQDCHPERYSAKDLAPNEQERRCLGVPQHDSCAGFQQSHMNHEVAASARVPGGGRTSPSPFPAAPRICARERATLFWETAVALREPRKKISDLRFSVEKALRVYGRKRAMREL